MKPLKPKYFTALEKKIDGKNFSIEYLQNSNAEHKKIISDFKWISKDELSLIFDLLNQNLSKEIFKSRLQESVEIFGKSVPTKTINAIIKNDGVCITSINRSVQDVFLRCCKVRASQEKINTYLREKDVLQEQYETEKKIWDNIPDILYEFVDYWIALVKKWHLINEPNLNEEKLDRMLELDREAKLRKFNNQIYKKVGLIKDVSCLSIGETGLINGIVVGTDGTAKVSTISAGGYNIQCFHYRTIVK